MGNFAFNTFKLRIVAGSTGEVDIINDTIKIALLEIDDEPDDKQIEFMGDFLGAGDATELSSTGYTGGFGGAGRQSIDSKAITVDQANNRAEFDHADETWTALSQAASEAIVAFVYLKEITNDAASPVLWKLDTDSAPAAISVTPNGSDVTITVDAQGALHVTD